MKDMKFLWIPIMLLLIQCKVTHYPYYSETNKARLFIANKNYKGAYRQYNNSLKYNSEGALNDNLDAYNCAVLLEDSLGQVKFFNLLQKKIECKQFLEDLKNKATISNLAIKSQFKQPNLFSNFVDSLHFVDQENRVNLPIKEKRIRDSLHLIIFNTFIKKHGFPIPELTGVHCTPSGTGYDMYKMNTLMLHFQQLKSKFLDSMLMIQYKNIALDYSMPAKYCNIIQDATRFGSVFYTINDTLYMGKAIWEKSKYYNNNRKIYGLPTIEEEYILLNNRDEILEKGFTNAIYSFKIRSESFPKETFFQENNFPFLK